VSIHVVHVQRRRDLLPYQRRRCRYILCVPRVLNGFTDVEACSCRLARVSATDALRRAADLLAHGDWQAAHAIVQDDPSPLAAWMHGIVHLLEGDTSNARYWYGQAGRSFPGAGTVREEVEAVRAAVRSSGDQG
jgi:hypothetical protein